MRDIVITKIVNLLETLCTGETRQLPIKTFIMDKIHGMDCSTKAMRKQRDALVLAEVDWGWLTDEQLADLFEIVVRQTYRQM